MGMKVIETNQTLNLAQYGLKAGDEITVICVGGGAGGQSGGQIFNNTYGKYCGNGGAAGFGGQPGTTYNTYSDGGGGGGAGAGYGAGGGGGGGGTRGNDAAYVGAGGAGGGAGEYKMTSHILNATTVNSIVVTIGAGGQGGIRFVNSTLPLTQPTNGGVTSFGAILSANGGQILKGGAGGPNSYMEGGGGGGGAGGYLLPMKIYGGSGGPGGRGGVFHMNSKNNNVVTVPYERALLTLGGGGGAGGYNSYYVTAGEKEQISQYGGAGGSGSMGSPTAGSTGIMSKGSGVVVVLW